MFSFFRKKQPADVSTPSADTTAVADAGSGTEGGGDKQPGTPVAAAPAASPAAPTGTAAVGRPSAPAAMPAATTTASPPAALPPLSAATAVEVAPAVPEPASRLGRWLGRLRGADDDMPASAPAAVAAQDAADARLSATAFVPSPQDDVAAEPSAETAETAESRRRWIDRLRGGLRRTGSGIAQVFTGAQIDDALYEELETALLMADAGVKATEYLLDDLKRRVKETRDDRAAGGQGRCSSTPSPNCSSRWRRRSRSAAHTPTVMMVAGVNGAGKTTTIGKLTRHLAAADQQGAAGRGRHLPRRRARAAGRLGRPQPRRDRQPGRRRPGGGDLRRRHRRQGARLRRGASPTPPAACRRSCT